MSVPADQAVPQQSTGSKLADLFGNVNRPALNSFVATSQARNGLVSAQTQDALIKAQQAQESQDAYTRLPQELVDANPGMKQSDALLTRDILVHLAGGDPVNAGKFVAQMKLMYGNPGEQTAGQQGFEGKIAPPVATPPVSQTPAAPPGGSALGPVTVSPMGQAQIGNLNATAGLHQAQADNPAAFHSGSGLALSPQEQAALNQATQDQRIDPRVLNSRNAKIYAQMELANPGQTNFNRLHADAALQSNSTFQQRAMSVDMLPGLLQNVTSLGKKLNDGTGYNDLKTVGTMQQWMNGQTNDPAYTEYMTARNDTLMRLANVMRGVGMSDKAHTAEVEAMAPTLSPAALDAWFKGQMSVVNPLLQRQNRITHLGEPGQGTAPLSAPPSGPASASTLALGDRIPTPEGAAPAPTAGPVHIAGDADYNALPKGTVYIGPDGIPRTK